jgi:myo-inositol 2-dehydrogenase/D-chiro-inositol 1-dehydrogenase
MKNNNVRFGLIGYGLFGAHHAAAIAATDGAELAAISVKSDKSQSAAREAHPATDVSGDYREMLARDDIDIVSVVVPNHLHYEVGRATLESGKHLLLEKPMALQVAHCDELNRLAEASGRILAVGHELRLSTLWGGVRRLIDEGKIGQPQYALVELSRFPYRTGAEGWRYDLTRVGNWILEEPIHFFDLTRWYLSSSGEPVSVYARANSRQADDPNLNDNFSAIVNFPGGAYAVVSQTLAAFGHHVTAKVTGTEGTIWATWSAADARSDESMFSLQYGLGDEVTVVDFEKPTGELVELQQQISAVAESVRDGSPPPCTGLDGKWSTALCLAAQRSVDAGQVVQINEL